MSKRGFASDNNSGVHPLIMEAIKNANSGHQIAYGDDPLTIEATERIKKIFGTETEVFFVFNGTAANVLGIDSVTQSYNSIICAETAHINVDECGAPEKFTGCKLLSVETGNGKITVDSIKKYVHGFGFEHHSQPRVICVTQSTEMGTVYTPEELKKLCSYAHSNNMLVHMDGARISNAAAFLGVLFREFTTDVGLDVLSFGGTKNGMMYGEAVIFFNKEMANNFKYRRKQGMQLASKMRFISAQFIAFIENDLWLTNATHANRMAQILSQSVKNIKGVKITQEVQSNGVFAVIPPEIIADLQKDYFFYVWDESKSEVRWMTSFDTTEEDISGFALRLKELLKSI